MSLAVKLSSDNIVVSCIEIPDEEDGNCYSYVNYTLKEPGNWISSKFVDNNSAVTVGSFYDQQNNRFISQKPFDNWLLNEDGQWVPPVKNDLRNMSYGYENEEQNGSQFYWSQIRGKWGHHYIPILIRDQNNKDNGLYILSKCIKNETYSDVSDYVKGMNVACLPKAYKYIDVHPDWHPEFVYPVCRETFAAKYGVTQDNPDRFLHTGGYCVPFDGSPYFFISYGYLCDLTKKKKYIGKHQVIRDHLYEPSADFEIEYMQQHPYIAGRTISELFKLIMDWDISYHLFNNRENTAILCHNVMSGIDMPINIYNAIYENTPPSIIEKYLRGQKNHLDIGPRPVEDPIVIEWFAEKYWDLRYLKYHDTVNIISLNEDHHFYNDLI